MSAKHIIVKGAKNNDMFLFITAAASWVLASAAQTMGIVVNKNIDKEDKKFLIPQEIGDGVMNIVMYAALTMPLMWATKKTLGLTKLSPKAKEGASVIASVVGAIVSSNILTPIARNKLGSMAQRKNTLQKVKAQDPNFDPYYQPLIAGKYNKIPTKMSNFMAFTRSNGMKI